MILPKTIKAVGYARVSSKDQEKEGFSIPSQISLIQEYSNKNNIQIVHIFKEAETAKKAGRKQFELMIQFLKERNDIKAILVEKTDRLYRNLKDYVELDVDKLDISVHYIKEGETLSSDSHSSKKFMHGIKVLMAKQYVDNLSEEVKKGHFEKLKLGIWPAKAPIGYLNRLENHSIVLDKNKNLYIKQAFELAATGNFSLARLKKELHQSGLNASRSGKELSKSAMSRILSNPFYYGEFIWNGTKYKASHEAIISKSMFDKVQMIMGFVAKPNCTKLQFTYRGPIKCSYCQSQITAEIKKKKSGKTYTYYHCTNGKGSCEKVTYVREEDLEKQFIEAFRRIHLPEDVIEYTRKALLESHSDEKALREAQISSLMARYKKLESYIDQSYIDKLEGKIDVESWESKTASWKSEQNELSIKLNSLRSSNNSYMLEGIKLMEIANNAAGLFPVMNSDEKREMINLVLSNSQLEGTTLRYNYNMPFKMFVESNDMKKWRERRDSNPRPSA